MLDPLIIYGERKDSQEATREAYQVTVSFLESQMDISTQEPVINSDIPKPEQTYSEDRTDSGSEPVPGMAGIWEYHYISDTAKAHMYTKTINWDGQAYRVTDCTLMVKDGSCLIQNQSWDGITFSFNLHFPRTGVTTQYTITDVSVIP